MRPANAQVFSIPLNGSAAVGSAIFSDCLIRCSFQGVVASGSLNGVITIQASNDQAIGAPVNQFTPTNWTNIGSATVSFSSSATVSNFLIPPLESSFEYMRVSFVGVSSASGTLTVRMKSLGA